MFHFQNLNYCRLFNGGRGVCIGERQNIARYKIPIYKMKLICHYFFILIVGEFIWRNVKRFMIGLCTDYKFTEIFCHYLRKPDLYREAIKITKHNLRPEKT